MEEKILDIIRTGRNFTQMAKDIATHVVMFIDYTHDVDCPFILTDDGWQKVGREGMAYYTTDEVYQYWIDGLKIKNNK